MRMNEFRRLAAQMDQHMQQLTSQGGNDAPAIRGRSATSLATLGKGGRSTPLIDGDAGPTRKWRLVTRLLVLPLQGYAD